MLNIINKGQQVRNMYIPDHKTKNEDKQTKNTKQKTKNIMILSNGLADQTCLNIQ